VRKHIISERRIHEHEATKHGGSTHDIKRRMKKQSKPFRFRPTKSPNVYKESNGGMSYLPKDKECRRSRNRSSFCRCSRGRPLHNLWSVVAVWLRGDGLAFEGPNAEKQDPLERRGNVWEVAKGRRTSPTRGERRYEVHLWAQNVEVSWLSINMTQVVSYALATYYSEVLLGLKVMK